jgi:hypothetical protein
MRGRPEDGLAGDGDRAHVAARFPTGPVDEERIQREAGAMLQLGLLGTEYATEVGHGTLVASMVGPMP